MRSSRKSIAGWIPYAPERADNLSHDAREIRPLIGIPVGHVPADPSRYQSPTAYSSAIAAAGGAPVLLPLLDEPSILDSLFGALDGLLLAGGGDIASARYGMVDSGQVQYVDPDRDAVELALAQRALAVGMPILGICRGIQALNVAAGGTLVQDIPTEISDALMHRSTGTDAATRLAHSVRVRPASVLAKALGIRLSSQDGIEIPVNSTHHQAVAVVAPELVVSARAPDGVIEAIERSEERKGFALGVQWPPERLVPGNRMMLCLFAHFVAACHQHREDP